MVGIGTIESIQGEVIIIRTGMEVVVSEGMPLYVEDVIKTGSQGNVKILYIDETVTILADNSRMVINEVSYNPDMDLGAFDVDIDSGMFYFSSGEIAKAGYGDVLIRTPSVEIGIRGTTLVGIIGEQGKASTFTLLNDASGKVGAIELSNDFGGLILSKMGQTSQVLNYSSVIQSPYFMTQGSIDREYYKVLSPEQYYKEIDIGDFNIDPTYEIFNSFGTQVNEFFAIEPMFQFVNEPSFRHFHETARPTPPGPEVEEEEPPGPEVEEPLYLIVYGNEDEPIALMLTELEVVSSRRDSILEQVTADFDGTGIEAVEGVSLETRIAEELDIAITEALESFTITISNVLDGVTLSAGVDNGDGSWLVTMNELTDLTVTPPSDFDVDFSLVIGKVVNQGALDAAELIVAQSFITARTITPELNDALVHLGGMLNSLGRIKSVIDHLEIWLSEEGRTLPDDLSALIADAIHERKAFAEERNLDAFKVAARLVIDEIDESLIASAEAFETIDAAQAIVDRETINVVVVADADAPTLVVNDVSGIEDQPIALNFSAALTDTDDSESLSIKISVLVDEVLITEKVTADMADEITAYKNMMVSNLKIYYNSNSKYEWVSNDPYFELIGDIDRGWGKNLSDVDGVNVYALMVETRDSIDVVVNEKSETAIAEALQSAENIAGNSSLSAGTENAAGSWTLTAEQLTGLTVTPPTNSDVDFQLSVTATTTEADGGDTATTTGTIDVSVAAVADVPTLVVNDVSTSINQPIPLEIFASLVDLDGSEFLSIIISNKDGPLLIAANSPQASGGFGSGSGGFGIQITSDPIPIFAFERADNPVPVGFDNGDGSWILTEDQLNDLILNLEPNFDDDFQLFVTAISTEIANGSEASISAIIDVSF